MSERLIASPISSSEEATNTYEMVPISFGDAAETRLTTIAACLSVSSLGSRCSSSAAIFDSWARLIFSSYTSSQSVNIGSIITPASTQRAPQVHSLESFSIPMPTNALPNVAPVSSNKWGQSLNTANSASILMALIASSGGLFSLGCLAWVVIKKIRSGAC